MFRTALRQSDIRESKVHEYSVIGHPRERIIFAVAFVSIVFGPIAIAAFEGVYSSLTGQVISLTVTVTSIFSFLYFTFNKWIWKISIFEKAFSFPNLNGSWSCSGETLDSNGSVVYEWLGRVCIQQSWDKMLITLTTKNSQSRSLSVVGSVRHIPTVGYKLSYSYDNSPNIGESQLSKHEGFCELIFCDDTRTASGHYFNGPNRFTFGRMSLTRE